MIAGPSRPGLRVKRLGRVALADIDGLGTKGAADVLGLRSCLIAGRCLRRRFRNPSAEIKRTASCLRRINPETLKTILGSLPCLTELGGDIGFGFACLDLLTLWCRIVLRLLSKLFLQWLEDVTRSGRDP